MLIKTGIQCRVPNIQRNIDDYNEKAKHPIKLVEIFGDSKIITWTNETIKQDHWLKNEIKRQKKLDETGEPSTYTIWKRSTPEQNEAAELAELRETHRVQCEVEEQHPDDFRLDTTPATDKHGDNSAVQLFKGTKVALNNQELYAATNARMQEIDEQRSMLDDRVKMLEQVNADLKSDNESKNTMIQNANTERESDKETISKCNRRTEELEKEITLLRTDNQTLISNVASKDQEITTLCENLRSETAKYDALHAQMQEVNKELTSTTNALQTIETSFKAKDQAIAFLNARVENQYNEIKALKATLSDCSTKSNESEQTIADQRREIERVFAEMKEVNELTNAERKRFTASESTLKAECDNLTRQIESMQATHEDAIRDYVSTIKELQDQREHGATPEKHEPQAECEVSDAEYEATLETDEIKTLRENLKQYEANVFNIRAEFMINEEKFREETESVRQELIQTQKKLAKSKMEHQCDIDRHNEVIALDRSKMRKVISVIKSIDPSTLSRETLNKLQAL